MAHNIGKFTTSLSAKLATRSRHVCLFHGAGASKSRGLPDVSGLQQSVLAKLTDPHKSPFEKQLNGRNLEQALSRVRRIAALLNGNDVIDELNVEAATKLDELVCSAIVDGLDTSTADLQSMLDLAAWIGRRHVGGCENGSIGSGVSWSPLFADCCSGIGCVGIRLACGDGNAQ